jgi:hypothetical protein
VTLDNVVDNLAGGTRRGLGASALVGTVVFLDETRQSQP